MEIIVVLTHLADKKRIYRESLCVRTSECGSLRASVVFEVTRIAAVNLVGCLEAPISLVADFCTKKPKKFMWKLRQPAQSGVVG
jgi:hypothetical protein